MSLFIVIKIPVYLREKQKYFKNHILDIFPPKSTKSAFFPT